MTVSKNNELGGHPMASIAQKKLFGWEEIGELGDLRRLQLVLENMPDEGLMQILEQERDRGRNEYPVRPVWNSVLAGVVYEHVSVESLRRELQRNGQLRQVCGFAVEGGSGAVPPSWVYSRFLGKLMEHQEEIEGMFNDLVRELSGELEDFGEYLAVDGKGIRSHARGRKKARGRELKRDGRRDVDADWGVKSYRGVKEDGTLWEKVKRVFGYKLHLVADATHELPVGYRVTSASTSELTVAKDMFGGIKEQHPEIIERCSYGIADRGYDDVKLIRELRDEYGIKPVIDIRNQWKDGEETKAIESLQNVVYSYDGKVFCENPNGDEQRAMAFGGFEKDRETLKYRCPARHYGYECTGQQWCTVGTAVRIRLAEDPRVFTPLARSSYRWGAVYGKRTAVERVNSRLDVSFGFERHYIRGLDKMKLRCSVALCVMLAMALGRIREKQKKRMRSLVQAVA
jgi:hypothetical protein